MKRRGFGCRGEQIKLIKQCTDRDEILDSYESFSKENTPDLSFFPLANLTFDESTGIMNIGSEN